MFITDLAYSIPTHTQMIVLFLSSIQMQPHLTDIDWYELNSDTENINRCSRWDISRVILLLGFDVFVSVEYWRYEVDLYHEWIRCIGGIKLHTEIETEALHKSGKRILFYMARKSSWLIKLKEKFRSISLAYNNFITYISSQVYFHSYSIYWIYQHQKHSKTFKNMICNMIRKSYLRSWQSISLGEWKQVSYRWHSTMYVLYFYQFAGSCRCSDSSPMLAVHTHRSIHIQLQNMVIINKLLLQASE